MSVQISVSTNFGSQPLLQAHGFCLWFCRLVRSRNQSRTTRVAAGSRPARYTGVVADPHTSASIPLRERSAIGHNVFTVAATHTMKTI
jgi:hypothetical protein